MNINLHLPTVSETWRKRLDTAGEIVGSIVMLAIICAIVFYCFKFVDIGAQHLGLTSNWMQSAGLWYAAGLVCAFYWPIKYRGGMRGHWLKNLPHLFLLALAGPWAIVLGIPM